MAMRTQITPPWPYCAHSWMQRRPFGCSRLSNYSVVVPDVVRFASGWVLVFSPMILVGYGLTLTEDLSAALIGVQRRVFPSYRRRMVQQKTSIYFEFYQWIQNETNHYYHYLQIANTNTSSMRSVYYLQIMFNHFSSSFND
jgi:hypothetical protein